MTTKTGTNFGTDSVMDIRIARVGNKDVYQRKIIENGVVKWIDTDAEVDNIVEEFSPSTDIAHKAESEAAFSAVETKFVPADYKGVNTDVLIRKNIKETKATLARDPNADKLMQDYMDRLIKFHAMLIRFVGSPEDIMNGNHTSIDKLKKNPALREAILLLIDVVGEPWTQIKNKI